MLADLHTHSTFSDGSLSPNELIDLASDHWVSALAITDHDEAGAFLAVKEYADKKGIELIAGVELSIECPLSTGGHVHLVGLFIDAQNEALRIALYDLKTARHDRALKMIEKLTAVGLRLDADELCSAAGNGCIGRPHIALMLKQKGLVSSLGEAFKKYLGRDGPAYVPKKKLPFLQAAEIIHQAGGIAILAHPISLRFPTYESLGKEILRLKSLGLDGLEVYCPGSDGYFRDWLLQFANEQQLLVSGGSDFHGKAKPDIQLGRGYGDLFVPLEIVDGLKQSWRKRRETWDVGRDP